MTTAAETKPNFNNANREPKLKFISRMYQQRISLIPMGLAMTLAWCVVIASLISVGIQLSRSTAQGIFLFIPVAVLAGLMAYFSYGWIKESQQKHELFIDGYMLRLTSFDESRKRRLTRQIDLRDVSSAEYYEPRDVSSLILRGRRGNLEIPLWGFGARAEKKIVTYIRDHGVKIVGVPNQIVI